MNRVLTWVDVASTNGDVIRMPRYVEREPERVEPQPECECCCHDSSGRCRECLRPKT